MKRDRIKFIQLLLLAGGLILFAYTGCDTSGGSGGSRAGDLDESFGRGGIVLDRAVHDSNPSEVRSAYAAVRRQDGQIVVAGAQNWQGTSWYYACLLDRKGVRQNENRVENVGVTTNLRINSVLLDDSDYILFAGADFNGVNDDFYRTRLTGDGFLDASFTGGMDDLSATPEEAFGAALESNGRILLAGYRNPGSKVLTVARYNFGGGRDMASFGGGKIGRAHV